MKKFYLFIMSVIMMFTLSSCRHHYQRDTWFSNSQLEEYALKDLPIPTKNLDNTMLENEEVFYFTTTESNFQLYAKSMIDYLLSNEKVFYLSEKGRLSGLIGEIVPYHEYLPIDKNYIYDKKHYELAYSLDSQLSDNYPKLLNDPIKISLKLETRTQKIKSFTYNASLSIKLSAYPACSIDIPTPTAIHFYDLYDYNSIELKDIEKVIIDEGPGSIAPPRVHDVITSTDTSYFEQVLNFIDNVSFEICDDSYEGVGTYNVEIQTKENNYNLFFTSYNEFYVNNQIYLSSMSFPKPITSTQDIEHYLEILDPVSFQSYGNTIELANNPFENIYYQEIPAELAHIDFTKDATLLLGEEKVIIESSKTFFYRGKYCKVSRDKDFSSLLEGMDDKTSYIQFVDENGANLSKMLVSQNIEYTLEEIKQTLNYSYSYQLTKEDGSEFVVQQINEDIILRIIPSNDPVLAA